MKRVIVLTVGALCAGFAPMAFADNIADCEVLIAERIEDEDANGSALVSSYRPAASFLSSVYDDEDGHISEIEGHKIRAVFCQRRSAIPTLRDYPILETGIALSLSQNFDSAISDVVLIQFKEGQFRSTYTGPGLSAANQAELDDVLEIYNLQLNDLAQRETALDIAPIDGKKNDDPDDVKIEAISDEAIDIEIDTGINEPIVSLPSESITDVPDVISEDIVANAIDTESSEQLAGDNGVLSLEQPEILTEKSVALSESENSNSFDDETVADVKASADYNSKLEETVPIESEAAEFDASCFLIARDALGGVQEIPISAAGLQNNLASSPIFAFPTPPGLNLRGLKCERDSLTPGEQDYKVARAGYPFLYIVKDLEVETGRAAALEFVSGKYRMNLLEGDFTAQELVDAKARILSFNDQHLKNILAGEGE